MRVITYNTHGGIGSDGKRRVKRIAETLTPFAADVLCFQEQYQFPYPSEKSDQPKFTASLLHRKHLFQRNLNYLLAGYGNSIAFKASLASQARHSLPSLKEQRGALEIKLRDVGGLRSLTVFCTHWGLGAGERKHQAVALAELVNAAKSPVLVCGDLNEASDGEAIRLLMAKTGLLDAGSESDLKTFPVHDPNVRIDYLLHSPILRAVRVQIIQSAASDHLPLMADFELVRKELSSIR